MATTRSTDRGETAQGRAGSRTAQGPPGEAAALGMEHPEPPEPGTGEGAVHEMRARHASAAAVDALGEAMGHLGTAADPRAWLKRNPWATLGAGAAVGFMAAATVVPSRKQSMERRLRVLERSLRDEAAATSRMFARKRAGAGGRMLKLAWRLGRPTLISMLTGMAGGAASGAAAGAAASDETAGHPSDVAETGAGE